MEASFWHQRWETGRVGFHLERVNPWLERFEAQLGPPGRILVPLCGKSLDLRWLSERGWEVTGVELSEIAARACFEAAGETVVPRASGPFIEWSDGRMRILQGDFFALESTEFDAVWDRAALIALPPDMRARYAARVSHLLRPGGRLLLVTLDYPQEEQPGPPFSVPEQEVRALYSRAFDLVELPAGDLPAAGRPDWKVSRIAEHGWGLVRRPGGAA